MFGSSEESGPRELSLREINAKMPRRVRLDFDEGTQLLVFSLIFLGVGAIWFGVLGYYTTQQARHRAALNREGREAFATVTKIRSGRSSYVHYKFCLGEATYQGEAKFQDHRRFDIHVGEQIPILFLPSHPSVNHPSTWAWWTWWDLIPQLFMLFFSSFGVVGLGYLHRERTLARTGWVTEAKVIACAPKGSRFRIDYEFLNEDQTLFDGANENSDEYETGSTIRVIYLRKNPRRNRPYPMGAFQTIEQ